jgi:hypothetical protein
MTDSLENMYNQAMRNPDLRSLASIAYDRMPNLSFYNEQLDPGTYGETTTSFIKDPSISLDRLQLLQDKKAVPNIVHHELVHALDDSYGRQSMTSKDTPEQRQFADAYKKLDSRQWLENHISILERQQQESPTLKRGNRVTDAKELLNDRNSKGKLYRGNSAEMRAFGTANSVHPQGAMRPAYYEDEETGQLRGVPHLDPTMATEQAILTDLAERARASKEHPHTSWIKDLFSK